jgi:hypothetical protein
MRDPVIDSSTDMFASSFTSLGKMQVLAATFVGDQKGQSISSIIAVCRNAQDMR